jgi:NADPH2:quinone reductase
MTRIIQVAAHGGPEVMVLADVDLPPPAAGEVRLKQKAIGLNFIDTYFRSGLYVPPQLPFTPGNEGAGVIEAVGEGVKGFKKGDRVAYTGPLGAYAEARNIEAAKLVKIPKGIDFDVAATLMLKGLTAEYLLFRTYMVEKGDTILVHAAAGATGRLLVQWGRALGATVIGTVGSEEKATLARKDGAHHVINYSTEDFAARVRDITKGKGVDVVYDGVGASTFMGSLECIRPFGMMVSFGNASGPVPPFDLGILAKKGCPYITRPTLFAHIGDPEVYAAMAKKLFKALKKGEISVPSPRVFKLEEAQAAHIALEGRETTGPSVLVP